MLDAKQQMLRLRMKLQFIRQSIDAHQLAPRSSITDTDAFSTFCEDAATHKTAFRSFRRNRFLVGALEHVTRRQGNEYLKIIEEDSEVRDRLPELLKNDYVGNPVRYRYSGVGLACPTTLRYIKVLTDLRRIFGPLKNAHIVEIGVGYGGQCRIIQSVEQPASYVLVDLPPMIRLATAFLDAAGIARETWSAMTDIREAAVSGDLLISNYAFSELRRSEQERYMRLIVSNSERGYVTYNHIAPPSFQSWSAASFARQIVGSEILDEDPSTHPKNVIVVWGSRH